MALPIQAKEFDLFLVVGSAATITAGFSVSFASPTRGEIIGVYLAPIDGSATTGGPAVLTLNVANVAGSTLSCAASAIGVSSGSTSASGNTLSARQFCNEGDIVKATLAAGLTSGQNAVLTFVLRARSI